MSSPANCPQDPSALSGEIAHTNSDIPTHRAGLFQYIFRHTVRYIFIVKELPITVNGYNTEFTDYLCGGPNMEAINLLSIIV